MAKKKQDNFMPVSLVSQADNAMTNAIITDPRYAITADPTGELNLSDKQKTFINNYSEVKNISYAARLSDIDEATALEIFKNPICKEEIHRINLARYQRKFTRRLLSIDAIGGYLTSVLTDEDVAECDRLEAKDKLTVAKMIIDLNKMKADAYNNPNQTVIYGELEEDVQDLDVASIKKLIAETKSGAKASEINEQKSELIKQIINGQAFEPSDITDLEARSIEELTKILEGIKNNG